MPTGHKIKNKTGLIILFTFVFAVALLLFSFCIRIVDNELMPVSEVFKSLVLWIKTSFSELFNTSFRYESPKLIKELFYYYEVVSRFKITLMTMVAGAVLSISGAVFQVAFRNPMAAPTMLGVTNGVSMGLLVLVANYSQAALFMVKEKYMYCYAFSMIILIIVILSGRFVGKNRTSVTDMFFVGAIISQICSVVSTFYRYTMEDTDLLVMQQMTMGTYINVDDLSVMIFFLVSLIAILPIFFSRFSFDAMSLDEGDAHALGINPVLMRTVMLIAGSMLVTASMIHLGSVGMISLIVPHIIRYIFGSSFKKIFWGCAVYGSLLLLICRDIGAMTSLGVIGALPMSTIVSVLTTPIFVIVLLQQRRGWE